LVIEWAKLTAKCPVCGYAFSDKEDFLKYASAGGSIQCPACGRELKINKDLQLEEIDLESLDDLG
jgi:Zn finger protein HypA/HybF involved in hydrogenase expression